MFFDFDVCRDILDELRGINAEAVARAAALSNAFLGNVDIAAMRAYFDVKIDSGKRRYGRGARLLPPTGYYYPLETTPLITNNASRGRLFKKCDNPIYVYDYDFDGDILRADMEAGYYVSYFERVGDMSCVVSYNANEANLLALKTSSAALIFLGIKGRKDCSFDYERRVGDGRWEWYQCFIGDAGQTELCVLNEIQLSDNDGGIIAREAIYERQIEYS